MIAVWGRTKRVHLISMRVYEILRSRGIRPTVLGFYGPSAVGNAPRGMQIVL